MYKELLNNLSEYNEILKCLTDKKYPIAINGVFGSQKAHLIYSLNNKTNQKMVYVASNEIEAMHMYRDLSFFLEEDVVLFQSREIIFYDIMARSGNEIYDRVKALEKIASNNYRIIVTSIDAISQKIISKEKLRSSIIKITNTDLIDLDEISQALVQIGYERTSYIEMQGQYSIRGDILDIFPVNLDVPVRIELFGDEIDSMRLFDKDTQRSIEDTNSVEILPARDLFYTREEKESAEQEINKDLKNMKIADAKIHQDVDRARYDYSYAISDKFWPFMAKASLLEYIDKDTVFFIDDIEKIKDRYKGIESYHNETFMNFFEKGHILKECKNIIFSLIEIEQKINERNLIYLRLFNENEKRAKINISMPAKQVATYNGHVNLFIDELKKLKDEKKKIFVLAGTEGKALHIQETLKSYDIDSICKINEDYNIKNGQIVVTNGSLNAGFEYPTIGLVIISDLEIFGEYKRKRVQTKKKDRKTISVFTDLKIGDLVVHYAHGIGQYIGIQQLVVENIKKDYLKIKYQGDNFLYIPINQLDLIQKYIGQDTKTPRLNKLGGTEWNKLKSRVKESVKDIAKDLLALYAKRSKIKGFEFLPDTVWQKQFEEMFPYQETDAQLKSIEEIKKDMEMPRPMERLLCGDVGFGKTEVALRAIFKACMSGKQVAYLVPTTVLAQQQYNNFKERMKDFPIVIEVLNRCKSPKAQEEILKKVRTGEVDILIGTHRILQKDVHFKDLGLLVVDEEQRFGVRDKEKIKSIDSKIDVLTLSATPIPRTLHMSLSGIKDISILDEPPKERYPVQTYVLEYDEDLIKTAMLRELSRNGQVFYLYNKVKSIDVKAMQIQKMLPNARIAVVHGRMNKNSLEDTILAFINKEYDILICTTIIESGIDMPNVNTLIVEEADKMGLSQLYQLRGRVGRANKLGYAYITYKKDKILSDIAKERLKAIKEFTEFGSGFKIAMRDMQIRGAGNLIGAKQHGHLEAVGYEMYTRLLESAIKEQKGEITEEECIDIVIDLNVNSYIDNRYISDEEQKIAMYKKIAAIKSKEDALDVYDELIDRFGSVPDEVNNLVEIALIKSMANEAGIELIKQNSDSVIIQFSGSDKIDIQKIGEIISQYRRKLLFTASNKPYLTYRIQGDEGKNIIANIKSLLQNINKTHIEV